MEPAKKKQPEGEAPSYGNACGAQHADCPNTWKGTCTLEAGHDGSHHCSQCNSMY